MNKIFEMEGKAHPQTAPQRKNQFLEFLSSIHNIKGKFSFEQKNETKELC